MTRVRAVAAVVALLHGAAAGGEPAARQLTRDVLTGAGTLAAPLPMAEFTAPAGAAAPTHAFSGRLRFTARADRVGIRLLHDRDSMTAGRERAILNLPPFDFEFVQSGDAILPLRRGPQPGRHRYWEYVLEPGRAWQEPGDGGLTRAAIPFALMERNENCLHYGVLSFLFGAKETSRVAFQVSAETCLYLKFDLWGTADARYTPRAPRNAAAAIDAYQAEVRARMPVRPIARLAEDYPGTDPAAFGSPAEVQPEDMTAYGFVIDGVHYASDCHTRQGPHPFCDTLDLPSYSLAKSLFAGLALMRLEQRYPGASRERIADYVPECRRAGGWDDITFGNTLDMATGRYRSADLWADEHAAFALGLYFARTHADKIRHACTAAPRREAPGRRFVYQTADTYVLGTAMNAFVRRRLGGTADLYRDVVVADFWHPLGLGPVTAFTRRTLDAVAQPFTGWGLVLHRDDLVRISDWVANGDGRIGGLQLLDPAMLAAAMQRAAEDRGLPAIDDRSRYQHGYYGRDLAPDIGCAAPAWATYLAGYGGIIVVLLPNGTVYYYVSDGNAFSWRRAAIEADRIRGFCSHRRTEGATP